MFVEIAVICFDHTARELKNDMSQPAFSEATISYEGGLKTSILIRTWIAKANRRENCYYCIHVKSDKKGIMKLRLDSDGERNLCWQLEQLVNFLKEILEVESFDSEVWIMGYGESYLRDK